MTTGIQPTDSKGSFRDYVALMDVLVTFGIGIVIVGLMAFRYVNLDYIYAGGLGGIMNDQIGYINAARYLEAFGKLEGLTIYPSTLLQETPKNYFYMPGMYVALAAGFRVLGYSATSAFIPGLLSYLLALPLTYLLGARVYGRSAGYLASVLVALFPVNVIFAFSAMGEMPLLALTTLSLTVFVFVPARHQVWAGPLLLLPPMLFRETGAVAGAVMFALLLLDREIPRKAAIGRAGLFAVGCAIVVLGVLFSPLAAGRPNLTLNNLTDDGPRVYSDAFAIQDVDRSLSNVANLIQKKFLQNLGILFRQRPDPYERLALWFLLAAIPIAGISGAVRRDRFAIGVAAAVAMLTAVLFALYTVWLYRSVRNLLLLQPACAVVFSGILLRELRHRTIRSATVAVVLVASLTFLLTAASAAYAEQNTLIVADERHLSFLRTVGHDPRKVLMTPVRMTNRYLIDAFPARWSFIPANAETLRLVQERYDVGTIVYPILSDRFRSELGFLSLAELRACGWEPVQYRSHGPVRFLVFKPKAKSR